MEVATTLAFATTNFEPCKTSTAALDFQSFIELNHLTIIILLSLL